MSGDSRFSLVYLCDWLPPDFGAVGQYALQDARARAESGQAIALYGLSSSASSIETQRIGNGSLRIVRLRAATYDRSSFRQRAWWTLRTNLALVARAFIDMKAANTIMFTGSPPFLLHLMAPLNLMLRKRLVCRTTDFFPECMMAEYSRPPLMLRMMHRLTLFWRRRVSQFEVLGEDQRRRLLDQGVPADRISLRRDGSPVAISHTTLPLPRPAVFSDKKILLYSGNYGVAHDYQTFLAGYRKHHRRGNGKVALWLNATGSRADLLEHALAAEELLVYRTKPVPIEKLASLLVSPDAHLITLRQAFVGYVLPSKVYGCIDSGKKVLYVGPSESDVHLLCESRIAKDKYRHAEVGDVDGVFQALEEIGAS